MSSDSPNAFAELISGIIPVIEAIQSLAARPKAVEMLALLAHATPIANDTRNELSDAISPAESLARGKNYHKNVLEISRISFFQLTTQRLEEGPDNEKKSRGYFIACT